MLDVINKKIPIISDFESSSYRSEKEVQIGLYCAQPTICIVEEPNQNSIHLSKEEFQSLIVAAETAVKWIRLKRLESHRDNWRKQMLEQAYKWAKKDTSNNVFFKDDKMIFNKISYTHHDIPLLPEKIQPQYIFTPSKDNMVAFYTTYSPLSNHYIVLFKIEGVIYNCVEMYMMYQKALTFNDFVNASRILDEVSPSKQKHIGRQVEGFVESIWKSVVPKVLLTGLTAKFTQSPACRAFLKDTRNKSLFEASPNDTTYGIGWSIFSSEVWIRSKHRGQNLMGIYLEKVRENIFEIEKNKDRSGAVIMESSRKTPAKTFAIGSKKELRITEFKEKSWLHLVDIPKGKSVSISSAEFKELLKKQDDIVKTLKMLKKKRESQDSASSLSKRKREEENFVMDLSD